MQAFATAAMGRSLRPLHQGERTSAPLPRRSVAPRRQTEALEDYPDRIRWMDGGENPHAPKTAGDPLHECNCTPPLIQRYLSRISGPLLDRIDLHIQVPAVKYKELAEDEKSEESAAMRERILAARQCQSRRLEPFGIFCNAQMTPRTLRRFCKLDGESENLMENAITRLGLSARAYDRILRVSRTIADLEAGDKIQAKHVAEAIQYRTLDRTYWQ
jgi:magnesium chelatase family protein